MFSAALPHGKAGQIISSSLSPSITFLCFEKNQAVLLIFQWPLSVSGHTYPRETPEERKSNASRYGYSPNSDDWKSYVTKLIIRT